MDKDHAPKGSDLNALKTIVDILGKHGKTDDEIKDMLEYHFPISSAVTDKILEERKNR